MCIVVARELAALRRASAGFGRPVARDDEFTDTVEHIYIGHLCAPDITRCQLGESDKHGKIGDLRDGLQCSTGSVAQNQAPE